MLFDFLTVGIICFAALAWGGNEPWAMAIVTAGSLLALAGRLIWDSRSGRVRLYRSWAFGAYEKFDADTPARYAHNDYLQAVAETGVVGLLILITAFIVCWRTALNNLEFSRDPLVRGIGLGTLGALTAVALQEITTFRFTFRELPHALPFSWV